MPLPAATNVAKVEMVFKVLGQICENVYYLRKVGGGALPDLALIADMFVDWWQANCQAEMSNTSTLEKVLVTDLTAGGAGIEYTTGLPISGSNTGVPLPTGVTAAVKLLTANRGRSYRGRKYVVGLLEGHRTGNQLLPAVIANFKADWEALLSVAAASFDGPFEIGVLSYYNNGAQRATPLFTKVTAIGVDADLDSQRRRLTGRGS